MRAEEHENPMLMDSFHFNSTVADNRMICGRPIYVGEAYADYFIGNVCEDCRPGFERSRTRFAEDGKCED